MALKFQRVYRNRLSRPRCSRVLSTATIGELHVLADLRPWEMSPTRCHLWEPARGETPAGLPRPTMVRQLVEGDGAGEKLQQLAANEGIKPSRAAQLRKARKEQEERTIQSEV